MAAGARASRRHCLGCHRRSPRGSSLPAKTGQIRRPVACHRRGPALACARQLASVEPQPPARLVLPEEVIPFVFRTISLLGVARASLAYTIRQPLLGSFFQFRMSFTTPL